MSFHHMQCAHWVGGYCDCKPDLSPADAPSLPNHPAIQSYLDEIAREDRRVAPPSEPKRCIHCGGEVCDNPTSLAMSAHIPCQVLANQRVPSDGDEGLREKVAKWLCTYRGDAWGAGVFGTIRDSYRGDADRIVALVLGEADGKRDDGHT